MYSNANDASTLITAGGVDSIGLMQMTQQIAQATGVSEKMLEERMPAETVKNATVAGICDLCAEVAAEVAAKQAIENQKAGGDAASQQASNPPPAKKAAANPETLRIRSEAAAPLLAPPTTDVTPPKSAAPPLAAVPKAAPPPKPAPAAPAQATKANVLTPTELLETLNLPHLTASAVGDWAECKRKTAEGRTPLLAYLKDICGVEKLPDRQKIANALSKALREGQI